MFEEKDDIIVFTAMRGEKAVLNNSYQPSRMPSQIKIKSFMNASADWLSPWGERDNLWPKTVIDTIRCCAPAQVCIEILTALFYGNGIQVYERNDDGTVKKVFDPLQQKWFRQTQINNYLFQAAKDYFTLGDQFPQLIRNKNKENPGIGAIVNISAPWCRLGKPDNSDNINSVHIHGNWENLPKQADVVSVPLLSSFSPYDAINEVKDDRIMMHVGNYTPGNLYYSENPFHALVRNGTLDIFTEIPKIRKRRIKDAMFIKYHVRINEMYWYALYGGMETGKAAWEGMKQSERKQARVKLYTEIDNKLNGSDNAFKSLFSSTYYDTSSRETINLIEIDKIETEVGEKAAFDPDKMTAVADVFLAFGLPSSVANTVLSDNKSRGGGSDIREGNTSVITRMPLVRDCLLTPVDLAMRSTAIEQGAPLLKDNQFLGMENTVLTTLDESKNGTKNSKENVKPA